MGVLIQTELANKIQNLPHFKSEALLPVFEAVVNSIQAIEDRPDTSPGTITVRIQRHAQQSLPGVREAEQPIVGFTIEDDGIGFDEDNYKSFLTSDSTYKLARGCKGIGRFFWLKAFERAEIESVHSMDATRRLRKILFTRDRGFEELNHEETHEPMKTVVKLVDYRSEYREQPSSFKTTKKIAQRILEHCLSFYISGPVPRIIVQDHGESVFLDEMYGEIQRHLKTEPFSVGDDQFTISHIKLYSTHAKVHDIVLCGNGRDVKRTSIATFLGTSQQFDEDDRKFVYTAYVSGDYLDKNVRSDRISFDIPEGGTLISKSLLTLDQILEAAKEKTKAYLSKYLVALHHRKCEIASNYVSNKNPTLRAVIHYCPEALDEIEPNSPDERVDEVLYRHKGRAEFEIRRRGQELLKTQAQTVEEIRDEYEGVTERLGEFQKDQLAAYVTFRKMIVDLLEKKLELNKDGRLADESVIHDILFPRKATTDSLDFSEHNLWLIDERLTFHTFATSDNRLCDSTSSDSEERPDILAFAEVDEDRTARTVSIVELKKPQRKRYEEDPTRQLYRYVRQIRTSEKIVMPNGRDLQVDGSTRFYCYAVCDLTDPVKEFAENANYAKLKGEVGYYSYNSNHKAHTEIIAFNKLVVDVQRRHKVFFEKLGL